MEECELLSSEEVFAGRLLKIRVDRVKLPNDSITSLEIIDHPGAAAVVPIDADGNVYMVKQIRYASGSWLLEIPAGKLEPGEAPETCAMREVEEETGMRATELIPMGFIWTTPGFTNERIWLYLATGLEQSQQNLDPDEVLEVVRMPLSDAINAAAVGEICDGKSVCGLLRVREHYARAQEPSLK